MTIKRRTQQRPTIDLTGPSGNAFALLGLASRYAEQLGFDADAIRAEMMSGDYNHLVQTFEKHFGAYVTLLVDSDEEER